MNKHNITVSNYQENFVFALAKRAINILGDWMQVPKDLQNELVGNSLYVIPSQRIHLWHMSTGVVGEVLEFFEAINVGKEGTEREELSDAFFYLVGMAKYIGVDWQAEMYAVGGEHPQSPAGVDEYIFKAMKLDDLIKKYNIYNDLGKLDDIKLAWVDFLKVWYSISYNFFDGIQDVIDENVNKLSKRFEGIVYSNQAAKERADKRLDDFPSGT